MNRPAKAFLNLYDGLFITERMTAPMEHKVLCRVIQA